MNTCKKIQKGGGSVTYCYLCGCPISTRSMFKLNNFKKYGKYFKKIKNKNHIYNILHNSYNKTKFLENLYESKKFPEKIINSKYNGEIINDIEELENKKNING